MRIGAKDALGFGGQAASESSGGDKLGKRTWGGSRFKSNGLPKTCCEDADGTLGGAGKTRTARHVSTMETCASTLMCTVKVDVKIAVKSAGHTH
jgi:hypothetical protein